MWESFFGFKKTPFSDSPDAKQLFASEAWNQVKARLEFLANHHGVGLLTGEVGAGKSTAARAFTATLNPNLYKILYVHFCAGSALDLLRQVAWELNLEPLRGRRDLGRQIAEAVVSSEKNFFMFLLRLSFRPPVPPESRQPWNITGTPIEFHSGRCRGCVSCGCACAPAPI